MVGGPKKSNEIVEKRGELYFDKITNKFIPAMTNFEDFVPQIKSVLEKILRTSENLLDLVFDGPNGTAFRNFATDALCFVYNNTSTIDSYSKVKDFKFRLYDWLQLEKGKFESQCP